MSYKSIPFGRAEEFNVVIEIPKGSANKYEYDEKLDAIKLDWVFKDGFSFIYDYGYVPQTLGGDGDHLDVFIFTSFPLVVGAVVAARAIGMIELLDRGERDDKILAVPVVDQAFKNYKELSDLKFDYIAIFEEFCRELAVQKNKIIEIKGFRDSAMAKSELSAAHKNYMGMG